MVVSEVLSLDERFIDDEGRLFMHWSRYEQLVRLAFVIRAILGVPLFIRARVYSNRIVINVTVMIEIIMIWFAADFLIII